MPAAATPGGFKAEYFNNKELQGQSVLVRTDEQVNFDWSRGRPAPVVNEDGFSVRWTGKFVPPETGQYQLGAMADDGVRVYLALGISPALDGEEMSVNVAGFRGGDSRTVSRGHPGATATFSNDNRIP